MNDNGGAHIRVGVGTCVIHERQLFTVAEVHAGGPAGGAHETRGGSNSSQCCHSLSKIIDAGTGRFGRPLGARPIYS